LNPSRIGFDRAMMALSATAVAAAFTTDRQGDRARLGGAEEQSPEPCCSANNKEGKINHDDHASTDGGYQILRAVDHSEPLGHRKRFARTQVGRLAPTPHTNAFNSYQNGGLRVPPQSQTLLMYQSGRLLQ